MDGNDGAKSTIKGEYKKDLNSGESDEINKLKV